MARVRKQKEYETLATRAARGEYQLVQPLDTMILKLLPTEGTLFGGLFPLGETTVNLAKKLSDEAGQKVPVGIISTRMRVLHAQGLVVMVNSVGRPAGGTTVWQITKRGAEAIGSKEKGNGDNGKGG